MNIKPNPKPHTNSEMDFKTILPKELTNSQRDELISQYVELVIDGMDFKTMEQYITDDLTDLYNDYTDDELKDQIELTHDEDLYDELVDNVTQQYPKQLNSFGN